MIGVVFKFTTDVTGAEEGLSPGVAAGETLFSSDTFSAALTAS